MSEREKLLGGSNRAGGTALSDDRRELLRIDDRLLLEYWKVGEPAPQIKLSPAGVTEESIAAMMGTSPIEALATLQQPDIQTVLSPWLMKIEWMLELMLRTLARMAPEGIALPALTDVNVSGGGIRFKTPRRLTVHDQLEMEIILPPFAPVRTQAAILRVNPQDANGMYTVATRFTTLKREDQERLIRHVLQKQAMLLRERSMDHPAGDMV